MDDFECLQNLGFSLNEAKVYTTLLKCKMLNGYEIAKFSGVSRSLVYEVIDRLVSKGVVIKIDGETNYYKPLEYDRLICKIKQESEDNISKAEELLKSLSSEEKNDEYVLNIVGFDKFINKAKELINDASKELSLSVWRNEFDILKEDLNKAVRKGVKVYIFTFEDIKLDGAVVFSYRISDAKKLFPYRRTVLIADADQCLAGEDHGERSIFMYTKNHSVVSLATDEIVLNIFWYKFIEKKELLHKKSTSKEFLQMMHGLAEELGIDANMTKNFMVFEFQNGRENDGKEH